MTRAQLNRILNPESVAVIGASSRENNLGHWLLKAILNGGYEGKVFTVNPKGGRILGLEVMTDIESLPSPIDLAVLSIPAHGRASGPEGARRKETRRSGCGGGRFCGNRRPEGKAMQEELKRIAGQSGIRLIGPNTIGFANMHAKLNASFSPEMGGSPPGNIGVVSQSGSVCETLYFRCLERGAGFSSLIAAGNEADLDMCDYLEYLLEDERTSVIALYVEQIRRPGRFVELLKKRQNRKPVVMFRTGRTSAGKLAAASHTGAMAGDDAIMKGVCRQLDVADARSYDDLIDTAVVFSADRFPKGRRLAVVTGPGAPGVAACDAAVETGLEMAAFSRETSDRLAEILPPIASWRNPVDLTGSAATNPELILKTIRCLLKDASVDGLIYIIGALSATEGLDDLAEIIEAHQKPVLVASVASLTQNPETRTIVEYLGGRRIPCFLSPERAVRAFALLTEAV